MTDTSLAMTGPRGARPKRTFSSRNIMLYGTLIVVAIYYALPLYVMIVTSLKGMPEIRLGNVFAPPLEITFEPWVKAWSTACTGINCDGLSRGFWNSVQILVPSVILSIAIASVNGYALANWKFKGSEVFFAIRVPFLIWRSVPSIHVSGSTTALIVSTSASCGKMDAGSASSGGSGGVKLLGARKMSVPRKFWILTARSFTS